jgi:hypothetical protein
MADDEKNRSESGPWVAVLTSISRVLRVEKRAAWISDATWTAAHQLAQSLARDAVAVTRAERSDDHAARTLGCSRSTLSTVGALWEAISDGVFVPHAPAAISSTGSSICPPEAPSSTPAAPSSTGSSTPGHQAPEAPSSTGVHAAPTSVNKKASVKRSSSNRHAEKGGSKGRR